MRKEEALAQDLAAVDGTDGVPWSRADQSAVDIGRGPKMVPLVGLPDDVVSEIQAEEASVCTLMPSSETLANRAASRCWTYYIRRKDGKIEIRSSLISHGYYGLFVDVCQVLSKDTTVGLLSWLLEMTVEPANQRQQAIADELKTDH